MTDKSVTIPRSVLWGGIVSLVLLVAGGIVSVFLGLPAAVADNRATGAVNRQALSAMQGDLHEIQEEQREQRRILLDISGRIGK